MKERSLLDRILEPGELSVVFQPIFEIQPAGRSIHAIECLIRGPRGTNIESADVLLEYVRRKREEILVDRVCVETALAAARVLPDAPRLSVNVHASTLGRGAEFLVALEDAACRNDIPLSRLTVEVVEHAPPWDTMGFIAAVRGLREMGVRVALDDIGLGQSNYKMILDARPDYFKIDRYLVHGAHGDRYRRAILESIAQLARTFEGRVIAEGVELEEDLEAVLDLGIDLIQGFLLGSALPSSELASVALGCVTPKAIRVGEPV
jgi:EAL domain-containing protein (putative c-di-GMP-specific phosphodiesterase class I)